MSVKRKKKSRQVTQQRDYRIHWLVVQTGLYVFASLLVSILLISTGLFDVLVQSLHLGGYMGALLAGGMFVSIFTAAPAVVILLSLSETFPIVPLAIVAGIGAMIGDVIILSYMHRRGSFVDKRVFLEESTIGKIIISIRRSKYKFLLTVIGSIVILTPLPDELGLLLMGISKMKRSVALLITLILNTLGIFVLLRLFS
jgi:hypothetical protein